MDIAQFRDLALACLRLLENLQYGKTGKDTYDLSLLLLILGVR